MIRIAFGGHIALLFLALLDQSQSPPRTCPPCLHGQSREARAARCVPPRSSLLFAFPTNPTPPLTLRLQVGMEVVENAHRPAPFPRIALRGQSGRFAYSTRHGKLAYGLQECPPATFPQRVRTGTPDNIRLLICGMCILCRSQACHQGCLVGIFSQLFRAGKPDEKTRAAFMQPFAR